ncbi:MAG: hypothetical protein QOJ62_1902 [Actinomycetota bacterium]|nr:hypothetical protein [Actinomycetota bacterium]
MGEVPFWLPSAAKHELPGGGGSMLGGPAVAVEHITWDAANSSGLLPGFANLVGWFTGGGKGGAPHLLADPCSGDRAQFFPANVASRALVHDSATNPNTGPTNRHGSVCLQVEWRFSTHGRCPVHDVVHKDLYDTPMLGLPEIRAWQAEFGVPLVWAMGEPTWAANRDVVVWQSTPGHYGHSQVPWQADTNHTDPGPMPLGTGARRPEALSLTEDDVIVILKNTAAPDQWISDGLQRRHIADVATLKEWQKVCKTVPATPRDLANILDVTPNGSADSLAQFAEDFNNLSPGERQALEGITLPEGIPAFQ